MAWVGKNDGASCESLDVEPWLVRMSSQSNPANVVVQEGDVKKVEVDEPEAPLADSVAILIQVPQGAGVVVGTMVQLVRVRIRLSLGAWGFGFGLQIRFQCRLWRSEF